MGIRSQFAIAVGKTSQWALKPSKRRVQVYLVNLHLKIDPHLLDIP